MNRFFLLAMRSGSWILFLGSLLILLFSFWAAVAYSFKGTDLGMSNHAPVSWEWADWFSFANTMASGVINAGALLFYALLIDRADKFLAKRAEEAV